MDPRMRSKLVKNHGCPSLALQVGIAAILFFAVSLSCRSWSTIPSSMCATAQLFLGAVLVLGGVSFVVQGIVTWFFAFQRRMSQGQKSERNR